MGTIGKPHPSHTTIDVLTVPSSNSYVTTSDANDAPVAVLPFPFFFFFPSFLSSLWLVSLVSLLSARDDGKDRLVIEIPGSRLSSWTTEVVCERTLSKKRESKNHDIMGSIPFLNLIMHDPTCHL
jgi:hypothetical protein